MILPYLSQQGEKFIITEEIGGATRMTLTQLLVAKSELIADCIRYVRYNPRRGTIDLKKGQTIKRISVEHFTGLVGKDIALRVVEQPNRWFTV